MCQDKSADLPCTTTDFSLCNSCLELCIIGRFFHGLRVGHFENLSTAGIYLSQRSMNYIFGPVNSRRLGRSLGIDLFSEKICNLNCIYCEVGASSVLFNQRHEYTPTHEIIEEVKLFARDNKRLAQVDVITITASGEPTLHSGFGKILSSVRQLTDKPVAVLTNSTTLTLETVRQELMQADIVVPSLDAAVPKSFNKVNRPAADIDLQDIISGLTQFSLEYKGVLWLEVLLAKGINDGAKNIQALQHAIKNIRVDRLQLNTVVRPPPEQFAHPLSKEHLQDLGEYFSKELSIPVDLPFKKADETLREKKHKILSGTPMSTSELLENIVQMLKRRPCTAADINQTFQLGGPEKVDLLLAPLVERGDLQCRRHKDENYYQ